MIYVSRLILCASGINLQIQFGMCFSSVYFGHPYFARTQIYHVSYEILEFLYSSIIIVVDLPEIVWNSSAINYRFDLE